MSKLMDEHVAIYVIRGSENLQQEICQILSSVGYHVNRIVVKINELAPSTREYQNKDEI